MMMRPFFLCMAISASATGFVMTKPRTHAFVMAKPSSTHASTRNTKGNDTLFMQKTTTDVDVCELSVDVSISTTENTGLDKKSHDCLKGNYMKDHPMEFIFKSTPEELYGMAVAKSRPKKESVSIHSMLTRSTTMAVLVTLMPLFAPGIGQDGMLQLFQYNEHISSDIVTQSQFCAGLQLVGALLGILRLPKNSPPVRELGMKQGAYFVTVLSMIALSNLNGTDQYLFDAFSVPGRVAFFCMAILVTKISIQLIDCSIADKARKGFHVGGPLMGNRLTAAFQAIAVYTMGFLVIQGCTPLFMEKAAFEELVKPYYTDIYNGALTSATVAVNQWIGFGALVGTLQFEKKISMMSASMWYILLGIFLAFDSFKLAYDFSAQQIFTLPEAQSQLLFQQNEAAQWHTTEIYFGLMGIAVLNSLGKVLMDSTDLNVSLGATWDNFMANKGVGISTHEEVTTLLSPVPIAVVANSTSTGM